MKKNLLIGFVTLALLPSASLAKALQIDTSHSVITFEATHLLVSKIPGRFEKFSGKIDLNEKDFTKSKVEFDVDITSISTSVAQRDDHLKSADFFDVQKHPTAKFRKAKITKEGESYTITGDLTIRGVTKKVSFALQNLGKVEDPVMKTSKYVFYATGTINRKDFGVSYGPNEIVGDNVSLTINLETMPDTKK